MITEEKYLEVKKLIADYELSNGIKPVVIKSLPSDDGVIREAENRYYKEKRIRKFCKEVGFIEGAKWMREKAEGNVL